jgi:hypothetical protein
MEVDGYSHPIKRVLAVVPTDEKQRLGVKSLAENLGKGFANPLQTGLVRGVVEGKDENGLRARCALANGRGGEQEDEREKNRIPMRIQSSTIITSYNE